MAARWATRGAPRWLACRPARLHLHLRAYSAEASNGGKSVAVTGRGQSGLRALTEEQMRRREKLSALEKKRVDERKYGGSKTSFAFFGSLGAAAIAMTVSSFLWYSGLFPSRKKLLSLFSAQKNDSSILVSDGVAKFRCAACKEVIDVKDEQVVVSHGRAFHADHFQCSVCEKALHPNNVIVSEGALYCEPHFSMIASRSKNCSECGRVKGRRGVFNQAGDVFCYDHRRMTVPSSVERVNSIELAEALFSRIRDRLDQMALIGQKESSRHIAVRLFKSTQRGPPHSGGRQLGLTRSVGQVVTVDIAEGLTVGEFLHTAAHEAVHAHLNLVRQAKRGATKAEEGLCELIAYLLLASTDFTEFTELKQPPTEQDITRTFFEIESNTAEPYYEGLRAMFSLLCHKSGNLNELINEVLTRR